MPLMRHARAWDLDSFAVVPATWTNIALSNRRQRTCEGLKRTAYMHSWSKLWKRYKKTKNPTATSKVPEAKAGFWKWSLHIAPPRRGTDHPSHPSPRPQTRPYPPPLCGIPPPPYPPPGATQGLCYLFSLSVAAAWVPIKPCLNFSSDFLSICVDKEFKNPGQ